MATGNGRPKAKECVQALRMTDSDKGFPIMLSVSDQDSAKVMQDRLMECYLNLLKQDVDMQVSGPQGAGAFLDNILLRQQFHHVELRRLLDEG